MPRRAPIILALPLLLAPALQARASIRIDNPATIHDNTDFPCIGRIDTPDGTGTGTLVGPSGMWVLTARHVVCDSNNMPLAAAGLRFRSGAGGITGHTVTMVVCNPTADFALIKLDDVLGAGYATSSAAVTNGTMFCTAGFGNTATNAGTPTASWTDNTNARRVYYNTVNNGSDTYNGSSASTYDFSCPPGPPAPVPGEGIGGPGDSGQPMLTGGNPPTTIRGIYVGNIAQPNGDDRPVWGATGVFVNITPAIQTWINSTIPAPAPAATLGVALLTLGRARRSRAST